MKVLHVITGLETGGAEQALVRLVDGLRGHGVASVVVSLRGAGTQGPRLEALGVPVHALELRPATLPAGLLRLRALATRTGPAVVHGWMYHGCLGATLAIPGVPRIWGIRHSVVDLAFEKPATRAAIRAGSRVSGRADRIVYNAETARAQHRALGYAADRDLVLGNGFQVIEAGDAAVRRARVRATLGLAPDAFVVGHFARFHPMKDHAGFLDAIATLERELPELRVLLGGRGVDPGNPLVRGRTALASVLQALGERRDVPDLLCACDVLCVSSRWGEAFPNVIGEAMACGVPCVVTDVGDSARIVGDTGYVVPPGAPSVLGRALRAVHALGREGRARLGASARERVRSRHGLDAVVAGYADLYRDLAPGGGA
mgnify:CR=1 FL=1